MSSELIGVLASLSAALTWSIAAIFYKKGELGLNSFESNALRCILPLATLIPVAIYINGLGFLKVDLQVLTYTFIATIVALLIGDTFYLSSIEMAGVSIAVSASYTFPIFTSIIAYFFLGEEVTSFTFIGVILTVLGIWLLSYENKQKTSSNLRRGVVFAVLASVFWASGISLYRYILFNYDPFSLTVLRMIILTLLLTPVLIKALRKASRENIIYLNIGGFFALALGGILLYYGLDLIGAARTSTISSVTPLFSVILAIVLLKEKLTLMQGLGIASITTGLMLVSLF